MLGFFVVTFALRAGATEVAVECPRLSGARSDELVARIHVAIHSVDAAAAPKQIRVECDQHTARVMWDVPPAEPLDVDESAGLLEGVLDAVDRRLSTFRDPTTEPAAANRSSQPPSPGETPDLTVRRRNIPSLAARRRRYAGGLGLGLTVEPWQDEQLSVGPRLDIGVGIGRVVAVATEGFRFGAGSQHSTFLFDVAVGAAWGAPFDPAYPVGVVALFGVEYFSAFRPEAGPNSTLTLATPTATLGIRGAARVGPTAVWAGVDGRYRPIPPEFGAPFDLGLSKFAILISVGAVLLADGD